MKKIKNINAFTLIELLIYVAIFAIVAGLFTSILLTVTRVNQRESSSVEVTSQLNFIMQRLQQLVRESSNIDISAGITTSTLKLRMKNTVKDPTCLSLISGVIKLAEGPDPANPNNCTSTASDLTSDRVIVDTFNLQKFTQYPGHDTLSIDIQMTYNSANPESRIQRTLQSAIARVSAATFDSDILPGSAYNFNLGQIGAPWQKIIMADGLALNPSYTFSNDTSLGMFRGGSNILSFSTAGSERMRIDESGNVGIGTTGLVNKLNINGNFGFGNGARAIGLNGTKLGFDRGSSYYTGFDLLVGANSGLVIDSSGNVGIGITGPGAKLEVNGNIMIDQGGSANHVMCWKADGKTLGYCSDDPALGDGRCTCN